VAEFKINLLVLDYETTGLQIEEKKHQPITCGAILVNPDTLEEIDRIYIECSLEPKSQWTKGAEDCHGLDYDYIMEQQSMADAATELFGFLIKNGISSTSYIMLCGHNVDFDARCLKVWMDHINVKLKITHRKLDTFPLGIALFNAHDSNELFAKVGVKRDAHNALEDAEAALEVVRKCRKIGEAWEKK